MSEQEPVYEYVKGQGWIPTIKPVGRSFIWNRKTWIITRVMSAPANSLTWRGSTIPNLLEISDYDLRNYANRNWLFQDFPGFCSAMPREVRPSVPKDEMYMFTEVTDV